MNAGFVWRMALRESRAEGRRVLLFTTAVAVGVAALVAINSFTDNLTASVRDQSRALLGADLSLQGRRPFAPPVRAILDSVGAGGARAEVVTFAAMTYVPSRPGARLVQVTAAEPGYPFYGEIQTAPKGAWATLQDGATTLVDPALLTALGAAVGDTLALGEARFVIRGTVLNAPGDVGIRTAFGPRLFIPHRMLERTKLLGFGARAQYEAFVKVGPGADADQLAARYRPALRPERVRVRTVADDQQNLTSLLDRLGSYLGLVALVALLLGGLGVASAVVAFVRQKLDTIAILRCVGATAGTVFAIYLLQAGLMGLLGSLAGAALGVGLQQLLPAVLADVLPVDVRTVPSLPAILIGVGTGLWIAVIFALLPLLQVRRVAPLQALRRDYGAAPARDPWRVPAALALATSVVALAALQVGNWRSGAAFAGGTGAALLVLWLASLALIRGVRRWFPSGWPYVWRQGLANLYRPANQTVTVVLSLGFGAFLLGTLYLVQHNLLRQFAIDKAPDRPNLVLFDIQPDQRAPLEQLLASERVTLSPVTPIVPMRILAVKGTPVRELMAAAPAAEPEDDESAPPAAPDSAARDSARAAAA
ncbi:MAG: FtsX-like permease family protein, partial [Gemmatimonadales bacterium]|nr:FtsX-like permease family protein [Gemmatimonadales bacterium]